MKKLLLFLVLLGGTFFVTENWPAVLEFFKEMTPASWASREIGGLTLDLPCSLRPYSPPQDQPPRVDIHVDYYRGYAGGHKLYFTHAWSSTMAGGLMLTFSNGPLGATAEQLKLEVISSNSTTGMLGDLRARRSDYISKDIPRVRVRCLLLERGGHLWFVECYAPESDAGAEDEFLRIVHSARKM